MSLSFLEVVICKQVALSNSSENYFDIKTIMAMFLKKFVGERTINQRNVSRAKRRGNMYDLQNKFQREKERPLYNS